MTELDQRAIARENLERDLTRMGVASEITDWEATIDAYLRRGKRVTSPAEEHYNFKKRDKLRKTA